MMGVIAMLLLSMLGASFLGKVGGAEGIPRLKEELILRHGRDLKEPEALKIRPLHEGQGSDRVRGILVRFQPLPEHASDEMWIEDVMRGLARGVFSDASWSRRIDFVEVVADAEPTEIRRRYTYEEAMSRRIGGRMGPRPARFAPAPEHAAEPREAK
jgi:hypothetical protein